MMTPEEIRARAERAAEWLRAKDTNRVQPELHNSIQIGWLLKTYQEACYTRRTDKELIAFCEDRGWRDPIPTEAEAVYWLINRPESDYRIMFDKAFNSYAYYFVEEEVGEWVHGWREFNPVEEALKLGYAEGEGYGRAKQKPV